MRFFNMSTDQLLTLHQIDVDVNQLFSIIDARIENANKKNQIDMEQTIKNILAKAQIQILDIGLAIQSGEKIEPKISVPVTRVVKKGNKLTKEQRETRIARALESMPIAVQKNYLNLIPVDDRPMKYNPLYEIGVESGKIKGGQKYVTDIKQYALDIGFAPEDLEPRLLTANYKKIMRGLWDPRTTLKSLKNCCGEYIKRFETVNGKNRKPYPEEIFGIGFE